MFPSGVRKSRLGRRGTEIKSLFLLRWWRNGRYARRFGVRVPTGTRQRCGPSRQHLDVGDEATGLEVTERSKEQLLGADAGVGSRTELSMPRHVGCSFVLSPSE